VITWGYPYVSTQRYGLGASNQGDGYIWDPSKGYGPNAFTSVTPPDIAINADGTVSSCAADPVASDGRPAPIYCVGETLLANGTCSSAAATST
jgi:hypothetical protein